MNLSTDFLLKLARDGVRLDDQELKRERDQEQRDAKDERIRVYEAFAEQNGGRLGDDLPGILQGAVAPSGEPMPVEPAKAVCGMKRDLEPCRLCDGRRFRSPPGVADDGLCCECRRDVAQRAQRKGPPRWRCVRCGEGRPKVAPRGLCRVCVRMEANRKEVEAEAEASPED